MARGPTPSQQRQIEALLAVHEPAIAQAFLAAVQSAHDAVDFAALVEAVRVGNLYAAAELLRIPAVTMFPLLEAVRSAMIAAGLSVVPPPQLQGAFNFNGRHPAAERIIAETGARLVSEIGSPGVEPIRAIILAGQEQGIGAQKVARQLAGTINKATGRREGGILGLDGPRAERAATVREILADPDAIRTYFNSDGTPRFKSTDRRMDTMVRRAIREGRALPAADVERIARAHEARLLKARAQAIALNESFTATAAGRYEAYRQMIEGGAVERIEKTWSHNTLRDPRPDHIALNGVTLPFDQPFVMGDGARMQHPHDPAGGARHSLGCRCVVIYRPQFKRPA